jgi:uncharacterized membrane protein required for colicin V production
MNWIDLILLAVWGFAAFWGLKNGATGMIALIVVLVVGLWMARPLAGALQGQLGFVSESETVQRGAAYLLLVVLALVASSVLGRLLGKVAGLLPLGGLLNRIIGAGVGLVAALLLTGAVVSGIAEIGPDSAGAYIGDSTLGGFLLGPFNTIIAKLGWALY